VIRRPGALISNLTSKQRAHLRGLAHHLRPILHIGQDGVTDAVLRNLEESFSNRELMKVKVLEGAPEGARETADQIVERMPGVEVVQTIGRTIALYRPDPEKPEIRLPK
jgi:RNA-binding protein